MAEPGTHTGRETQPGGGTHTGRLVAPGGGAHTGPPPVGDVQAALDVLAALPGAIRDVYPGAATIRLVAPLAARAIGLRDRELSLASGDAMTAAADLLADALKVIGERYAHLSDEHKRLAGKPLDVLDAAVVGQGGGALTRAVADVLRRAWPVVKGGAASLARWFSQKPIVRGGTALAAAGAGPGVYRASKKLGSAVDAAAGGIEKFSKAMGGWGGVALLVLVFWLLTKGRR